MSEARVKIQFPATLEYIQDYDDEMHLDLKSTDEDLNGGGRVNVRVTIELEEGEH